LEYIQTETFSLKIFAHTPNSFELNNLIFIQFPIFIETYPEFLHNNINKIKLIVVLDVCYLSLLFLIELNVSMFWWLYVRWLHTYLLVFADCPLQRECHIIHWHTSKWRERSILRITIATFRCSSRLINSLHKKKRKTSRMSFHIYDVIDEIRVDNHKSIPDLFLRSK
jgi:hypothetical protein